nr:hypothetical protein [Roseobacter litoralis]
MRIKETFERLRAAHWPGASNTVPRRHPTFCICHFEISRLYAPIIKANPFVWVDISMGLCWTTSRPEPFLKLF